METKTEFTIEPTSVDIRMADLTLAKELADTLDKHYPGHAWAVYVDSRKKGGIVNIKNWNISFSYGMRLKLDTVLADPERKCVMRAGGELLERARMVRGAWKRDQYAEHIEGVPLQYQPLNGVII